MARHALPRGGSAIKPALGNPANIRRDPKRRIPERVDRARPCSDLNTPEPLLMTLPREAVPGAQSPILSFRTTMRFGTAVSY
ncbi:hypothetical protein MEX01_17890 [Methylorubrum extorquens]|nr:hypothetical protein MEX01_17890 [Methylorubrum extorquens]